MIEKLTLQKFKQFKNKSIPLKPNVVLIAGSNNSGKSSILHSLAVWEFCRTVIETEKGFSYFLPPNSTQGTGLGDDEFSPINIPTLPHLWTNLSTQKTLSDSDGYTLRIRCEWTNNGQTKELEFGLAHANDRLFVKTTHSTLTDDDAIPAIAYLPPFAGITDKESRIPGPIRRRLIGQGLSGAVLRNILLDLNISNSRKRAKLKGEKPKIARADLKKLRETDPWELLQQALRRTFKAELYIAPFRDEYHSYIRVQVVRGDVTGFKLTKYPKYKNRDIMVEGSGFLQWLSVYTLASQPETNVLLLDEPDAHLHPSLQHGLIAELENLAERTKKQILIATHSTELLRETPPESILAVRSSTKVGFLNAEHQKIGLFEGLGSHYAPRIDAARKNKRIVFVEGEFDLRILKIFAEKMSRKVPEQWVEWVTPRTHKERKQLFRALSEEIDDLVALSLRDRDDESVKSVGEALQDKTHTQGHDKFICKKWRRRNIESYLLWPDAIASATDIPSNEVIHLLSEVFGITISDSFSKKNAPEALLEIDGKTILSELGANREEVARNIPHEHIPEDIITLIDNLNHWA